MKLSRIAQMYGHERNLAEQSRINYEIIAGLYETEMSIHDVENVTRESLIEWRDVLFSRMISPATWNTYMRHIGILLNFAVTKEIIKNPRNYSVPFTAVYTERPKVVPLDNIRLVISYLEREDCPMEPNWFWSLLVRLLFYTGMRRRQITGLKWSDIDFVKRTIELQAGYSKTMRSWSIPLPEPVFDDLQDLLERTKEIVGDDPEFANRFVFDIGLFNPRYKCKNRIVQTTISNFFKRISEQTGVRISAHKMRHTMATELAAQGKYKELQQLLGHVNVSTTMKYIHPEISRMRSLVETLNSTGI